MPSQHGGSRLIRAGDTVRGTNPKGAANESNICGQADGLYRRAGRGGIRMRAQRKVASGRLASAQKGFEFWHVHAKGGGRIMGRRWSKTAACTRSRTTSPMRSPATRSTGWRPEGHNPPFYLGVHFTAPHSPGSAGTIRRSCSTTITSPANSPPSPERTRTGLGAVPLHSCRRRRKTANFSERLRRSHDGDGRRRRAPPAWLDAHGLRERTLILFTGTMA